MYHKLAVGCDKSIFLYVSTASKENGTGYAAVNLQVLHIPYTQMTPLPKLIIYGFDFIEGSVHMNLEKDMYLLKKCLF